MLSGPSRVGRWIVAASPRHDGFIADRDRHFFNGSSDGSHQLSIQMLDAGPSTRLVVSLDARGFLRGRFEELTDERVLHVSWSLAAPRLSG